MEFRVKFCFDDFGSESIYFEINSSRSKIASQWGFDGVGLLSTL